jgi:hypothetical protein
MMDEMAIELGLGRIDYVTRLLIAGLARDPYLRPPVTDGLTWTQLRPMAQELVNRKLEATGAAARRWAEVSEAIAAVTASADDPSVDRAELGRHLSDVGTELLGVVRLVEIELRTRTVR